MQICNFRLPIVLGALFFTIAGSVSASKSDIGLTCDKEITPERRYIEIGDTVTYTIEYLEKNNYRCGEFLGRVREIVSCSYRIDNEIDASLTREDSNRKDRHFEILLTIEEGKVTMIETRFEGIECN